MREDGKRLTVYLIVQRPPIRDVEGVLLRIYAVSAAPLKTSR